MLFHDISKKKITKPPSNPKIKPQPTHPSSTQKDQNFTPKSPNTKIHFFETKSSKNKKKQKPR
jgi:hypothetical protein